MASTEARYSGKVVRVGNSQGIRIESSFFRSHPEFSNDVDATVVGTGALLISSRKRRGLEKKKDDPVVSAFLGFLEREMTRHPELIGPLDSRMLEEIGDLVKGMKRT